ncbi:MAG: nucleotidyltransferase domain-containing protein [Deltaproteobacteria bacterium]|nr:nucleotidyltransferase domain-containing protein [Deltaproteobacteria bacterium]
MVVTQGQKAELRQQLVSCLSHEDEVEKIVIFGSFLTSSNPNDLDVAVFQTSTEPYLSLALRYRRKTRALAKRIPLDIIPLRAGVKDVAFLSEIDRGEVIYER